MQRRKCAYQIGNCSLSQEEFIILLHTKFMVDVSEHMLKLSMFSSRDTILGRQFD